MADLNKYRKLSDDDLENVNGGMTIKFSDLSPLVYGFIKGKVPEEFTITPEGLNEQWELDSVQENVQNYLSLLPTLNKLDRNFVKKYVNQLYGEYERDKIAMPESLDKILSPYR